MENNSVTTKRKTKQVVALLTSIFLLCAVGIGGMFAWKNLSNRKNISEETSLTESDEEESKEIVLDAEGMPEDGSDITETKKAADSETLRKLLAESGKFAIELTEDIRIDKTLTIKGTKKLTGTKSIIMELYADATQSVILVPAGATLIQDGITLDGNGIANGVKVEKNAGYTGVSGQILYPVPYGVLVGGSAKIQNITIDHSMDIGICVEDGAKASLSGGKIVDTAQTGVHIQPSAQVTMSNNVLVSGGNYCVRNRGTCLITGGTLKNASGCLVYSVGDLKVDYKGKNSDDKLEWYNAKGEAGIRIGGSSTAYIQGLYIHDTKGRGIRAVNHNKVVVENCTIANTGSYGFDSVNGKEEAVVTNLTVLDTKASAVRTRGTTKVTFTDLVVKNTEGFGIKTENNLVVAKNVQIENSKMSSIWGDSGSTTIVEDATIIKSGKFGVENNSAKMELKNITITDPARMGFVAKKESITTITNMTIQNAPERGIYNLGGTVTANNVTITAPGAYGVSTAKSGGFAGKVTLSNLTVSGVKEKDALNCYESALEVKKGTISDVAKYGARASKGGKLTLTDVKLEKCKQRGVGGSGGTITLTNVIVDQAGEFGVTTSKTKEFTGQLTANNLTVTNVKGNALNNNSSVLSVNNGTIQGITGNGAYIENGATLTLTAVNISDCTKRGVCAKDAGTKVILNGTKINNTSQSGIFLEPKATVQTNDVTVKHVESYGIFVKSATLRGQKVRISDTKENALHISSSATDGQSSVNLTGLDILDVKDRGVYNLGGNVVLKCVSVTNPETYGITSSKVDEYVGKVEIEELHITNVKTNAALNCNASVLTVKNGTIAKVKQNAAYVEKGGNLSLTDVNISDCERRGVFANNADTIATLNQVTVSGTKMSNIRVVDGAALNANNLVVEIDDLAQRNEEQEAEHYGIYINGKASQVVIDGEASVIKRNITEGQIPAILRIPLLIHAPPSELI